MNLRLLPALALLLAALPAFAQEVGVTPRYQAIAQTKRTRLVQVGGTAEVQPSFAHTAAYSPNGQVAVFASNVPTGDDEKAKPLGQLFVWDLPKRTFRKEIAIDGRNVVALALNGDGSRALLATQRSEGKGKDAKEINGLSLWDLNAGKEIADFGKLPQPSLAVALSPDGTTALVGGVAYLRAWNLKERKESAAFKVDAKIAVAAVALLADGKSALAGVGPEVRLLDLASGKDKQTFKAKGGTGVMSLAVSADGKRFAAADFNQSISLWDTASGKELGSLQKPNAGASGTMLTLALAEDGKTVISCWSHFGFGVGVPQDGFISRWDGTTNKETWAHAVKLNGLAPLRLDGKKVIFGGGAGLFCEWDIDAAKELASWGGHKGQVNALALDGDTLISAGNEGILFRWNRKSPDAMTGPRLHSDAIAALAVSADGQLLLSAGTDRKIKVVELKSGKVRHTLAGHTGNVTSLVISRDGSWAASGSEDRSVRLWDLKSGKLLETLEGHAEGVNAVALSPQQDWLASASDDNLIKLWPLKNGKSDASREPAALDDHDRPVTCLAFTADGQSLLSGSKDNTLKLWDVAGRKVTREFKGHKNWITSAVFLTPDLLVSASDDLTVRLWDVKNGAEVDRIDLSTVSDGPRSLLRIGPGEFAVGTSGWVVLRFELAKGAPAAKQ